MRLFPLFFVLLYFSLIVLILILCWLFSGDVKSLTFSDSGELLASGGEESAVYIVRPFNLSSIDASADALPSDIHLRSSPQRTKPLSPKCLRADLSAL